MVLNISSRSCELIIGSQNWTPWIDASAGIQIGYPEYEMGSGLMPVEGSITLKYSIYDPNLPSNPNYFLNPNQWKRGQTVSVRVVNIGGTLTYLPCSGQLLYLLRPTQRPKVEMDGIATLVLNIGCRLALDNFPPEPNRNVAGVVAGVSTNRNTIIGNILNYINVPNSIGSLPYPIDYPLPKTDGNWISFAGAIADSAGYYLRCNTAGTVIAESIMLDPSAAIEVYVIGTHEKSWEPNGDISEQPLEKLILASIKQNVIPVEASSPNIVTEKAPRNQVSTFPAYQGLTELIDSKRTTITQGLIPPDRFQTVETIEQPLCQVSTFAAYQAITTLVDAQKTTVTYFFLINGVVYKQVEDIEQPLCQVLSDPAFQSDTGLVISKKTTTTWAKTGDKLWTKTVSISEPKGKVSNFPAHSTSRDLIPTAENSDNKDTIGPPTNIGETSENTISEENLTVTVYAQQLAEDPFRERQRTINVPYAMSRQQLTAYGDRFNKLLTGRSLGFQFGGALTDIALGSTFKPFAQVAVREGTTIYYPKLDAIQYALNLTECFILWNGIIVASAPATDPEDITRPVNIPFGLFVITHELTGSVINDAILLSDISHELTGRIWNVQVLPDRIAHELTGRVLNEDIPPPTGLVAKTITYFACEEANGVRYSSHTDSFILQFTGSGSINSVSGAVNDALPTPNGFSIFDSGLLITEDTFSLNEASFIALSFAFKFTTTPFSSPQDLFANEQFRIAYDTDYIQVITVDDTATEYTLTYSLDLGNLDPSNVTDWHLAIVTVNTTTGEMSLQMNNMSIETASCPTLGSFAAFINAITVTYSDWIIDEIGAFNADLDTTDRNTLWNLGDFNTYTTW